MTVAKESVCYGTSSHGRLENGVSLPELGNNFGAYSTLGYHLGRTYLHSTVHRVVLDAYRRLETSAPGKAFVYGETGWKSGGRFRPHKTHQNGLSVDFMVPVLNQDGKSVPLPTGLLNKYGYGLEFDLVGRMPGYVIDFDAMAEHLYELHRSAEASGIGIWRVIFDPKMTPKLRRSRHWPYLSRHVRFSKKRSWIRHDDHYHVDFNVACDPY